MHSQTSTTTPYESNLNQLGMRISRKHRSWIVFITGLSLMTSASFAANLKIGYVNPVTVVETAPQGESALKKLEEEFGPRDRELKAMREQIGEISQDLDKNSLVMTENDRLAKQKDVQDLTRRLRRMQQEVREDYNLRRNEELGKLQKIVKEAIVELSKKEGYDLIIEQAVYVKKSVDITDKVLKSLKERANKKN